MVVFFRSGRFVVGGLAEHAGHVAAGPGAADVHGDQGAALVLLGDALSSP